MFLSIHHHQHSISFFFFFNDTATTEIYTLSLHDALPIVWRASLQGQNFPNQTLWCARLSASWRIKSPETPLRLSTIKDSTSVSIPLFSTPQMEQKAARIPKLWSSASKLQVVMCL